jgi:hypothetical protein
VDIIDLSGQDPLRAAQCKLHEEGKPITEDEIRAEVEKAKHFTPPLGLYLILTTAKGNKSIHDTVIAMNRVHRGCQENCVTFFYTGTRSPNKITN